MSKLVIIKILFLVAILHFGAANAEYYRWVDENGRVQYSDQVPSKDIKRGHDRLDNDGVVKERISGQKSPEEIRKLEEAERIAAIRAAEAEKQAAYDQALVASFTTVDDLINARDERIGLLEQSIEVSKKRLEKQDEELKKLSAARKRFIAREMDIPKWINENETLVKEQIVGIEDYIHTKEIEKQKLNFEFEKDIKRYKELTEPSDSALSVR